MTSEQQEQQEQQQKSPQVFILTDRGAASQHVLVVSLDLKKDVVPPPASLLWCLQILFSSGSVRPQMCELLRAFLFLFFPPLLFGYRTWSL